MARRFLPALRRGVETKVLSVSSPTLLPRTNVYGLRDSAAGWDMETVVIDGYERVIWVFKAVEVIAGNASRLPFKITDAEENEVEAHPLLRVMNKKANPLETGRQFRKRLSAQILLSKKGAFVEVTRNRGGQVTRLDLLPPDRVRIVPDPGGDYVDYFEFTRYDGQVRNLPPDKVRWIREPHPLDPFSGVTPLEAAGMSVELDHLARAYNVSFIKKDGRPGGILGVDADGLEEEELERISRKMKPGPHHAGEITAIGTGPGGLNYVDTSARPRDMAYETTSDKSKKEILAAFGVPESMAGDASGRTWDNAEQEEFNFWHDPMLPHLDLIAAAFDGDVDEDLDCGYDTSTVEALELPARRRREERRQEWNDGLITIKEYRSEADYEDIDNAHTRALWISPAKAPVPGRKGDEAALGLDGGMGGPGGGMPPEGAPPEGGPATAQELVQAAVEEGATLDGAADQADLLAAADDNGQAALLVDQARAEHDADPIDTGDAQALVDQARLERKDLPHDGGRDQSPVHSFDPGDEDVHRVELAVSAALDAMLARQAGVVTARLESPKIRRGTRYWTPDGDADERVGDEPIDSARVVDTARWVAETQETLRPIVAPAANEAANGLLAELAASGALIAPAAATADVVGRAQDTAVASAEQVTAAAARAGVAPAMLALTVAQAAVEDWLRDRIIALDRIMVEQQGPSLPELVAAVQKMWEDEARDFARGLAVTVAQTAVLGGRDAAAEAVEAQVPVAPPGFVFRAPHIDRIWRTRGDEKVRASHERAAGQVRAIGEFFLVGGAELRYPHDPLGPPEQTFGCRCSLVYEWPADAEFTLAQS